MKSLTAATTIDAKGQVPPRATPVRIEILGVDVDAFCDDDPPRASVNCMLWFESGSVGLHISEEEFMDLTVRARAICEQIPEKKAALEATRAVAIANRRK